MYATGGIADVLGIPADVMRGRSFYYCISENCLPDAVKCLENAKGNNSIAYLRFWFRDPRLDDEPMDDPSDNSDEEMPTDTSVDQDVGGGVRLHHSAASNASNALSSEEDMDIDHTAQSSSRTSSGDSTAPQTTHDAIFGDARAAESSTSSLPLSPEERSRSRQRNDYILEPIELEAVISCTSDGLVVCLRRARPILPTRNQASHTNGLFAAPWATDPIMPAMDMNQNFAYPQHNLTPALGQPSLAHAQAAGGPDQHDFMASIREQAIFAWALTGINGALHKYGYGRPTGEALPQDGLPVWERDPYADLSRSDSGPTEEVKFGGQHVRERDIFGDPGLDRNRKSTSSGERSAPRTESGRW